ncbi:hypothetical protein SK128_021922 [Halocaridina rubra]|uniref:Uncharacterized protein n=1 Tax=Halocaridina rubra TaxID=373956 RepID=A0AAN8WH08_HALRR
MKIKELRNTASSTLGGAFDLKEYHDIVMQSVGPLDLLEDEVNAWIAGGGRSEILRRGMMVVRWLVLAQEND